MNDHSPVEGNNHGELIVPEMTGLVNIASKVGQITL